jgi:ubiquitin C-terminal hydrolase
MYICDVRNRTYHWQYLLKTSCCNATEREAIDANDSWACPACINLNQNEKKNRILDSQKREIVEISWNAFTYCKRLLIRQSAVAYTIMSNLLPLALHQNS